MKSVSRWSIFLILTGGWLGTGCIDDMMQEQARTAFAADFHCPQAEARTTSSASRYRVRGCGRAATYVCDQTSCGIQVVEEAPRQAAREEWKGAPPKRGQPVASEVRLDSHGGKRLMRLELVFDDAAWLRLTAAPSSRDGLVQLKLIRKEKSEDLDECNLAFMVNGQVLATPPATPARDGGELSHRIQIGRSLLGDFASAEKITLRVCDERYALTRDQVVKVREFVDRFQEEMAWNAAPRSESAAGMVPPSGGWPDWKGPAQPLPPVVTGASLEATALFKKLSPSVFKLEAKRSDSDAQGSAVAISKTELVTNCHVVQGALKLTLKQGKREWPASVVRADPISDRCTITTNGANFSPVAGVRSYDSLEVGEPAYTLGSPVGLDLTLSNGIVSGRREEDGRQYVQTTAPISPGSSGGGLFDARGNLIGITTLVLVGREHLNQSLNFAIPADAFGKP